MQSLNASAKYFDILVLLHENMGKMTILNSENSYLLFYDNRI